MSSPSRLLLTVLAVASVQAGPIFANSTVCVRGAITYVNVTFAPDSVRGGLQLLAPYGATADDAADNFGVQTLMNDHWYPAVPKIIGAHTPNPVLQLTIDTSPFIRLSITSSRFNSSGAWRLVAGDSHTTATSWTERVGPSPGGNQMQCRPA